MKTYTQWDRSMFPVDYYGHGPAKQFIDNHGAEGEARLEAMYRQGIDGGIANPIVLVLDLRDPAARAMAESLMSVDAIRDQIAATPGNCVPTACFALAESFADSLIRPHAFKVADQLPLVRSDFEFRVVAASGNCVTLWNHAIAGATPAFMLN